MAMRRTAVVGMALAVLAACASGSAERPAPRPTVRFAVDPQAPPVAARTGAWRLTAGSVQWVPIHGRPRAWAIPRVSGRGRAWGDLLIVAGTAPCPCADLEQADSVPGRAVVVDPVRGVVGRTDVPDIGPAEQAGADVTASGSAAAVTFNGPGTRWQTSVLHRRADGRVAFGPPQLYEPKGRRVYAIAGRLWMLFLSFGTSPSGSQQRSAAVVPFRRDRLPAKPPASRFQLLGTASDLYPAGYDDLLWLRTARYGMRWSPEHGWDRYDGPPTAPGSSVLTTSGRLVILDRGGPQLVTPTGAVDLPFRGPQLSRSRSLDPGAAADSGDLAAMDASGTLLAVATTHGRHEGLELLPLPVG